MNVIILGGFLGSGKTTVLIQLAKYLVRSAQNPRQTEVAIVENEVGETGVDDKLLRGGGFSVDTLFSGCACCTVSGELTVAARRIRDEFDPHWLIIETTGVAYPPIMRENLEAALGITSRIAVVTDAVRWTRLMRAMRALIEAQIEGADVILINKCDAADADAVSAVEADLRAMSPDVPVMRISAAGEVGDEVWLAVTGGLQ